MEIYVSSCLYVQIYMLAFTYLAGFVTTGTLVKTVYTDLNDAFLEILGQITIVTLFPLASVNCSRTPMTTNILVPQ